MIKVYCENCKHCGMWRSCGTKPYYVDTPYRRQLKYVDSYTRNKNNDCKNYEKIKLPKEPPLKTLDSKKKKTSKKHWWNK